MGGDSHSHRSPYQQNHDLQRAIGLAIGKCLRRAVSASGATPSACLTAIADSIETNPLNLDIAALDTSAITTVVSGSITVIRSREVLTADQWREFLELAAIETHPSLWVTPPKIDIRIEVEFCQRHFADELIQTFKTLGADSDPAWFALVLRFLSEIHSDVKQLLVDNDTFKDILAAHFESMQQTLDEITPAPHDRAFTEADALVLEEIRRTMADLRSARASRFVLEINALSRRRPTVDEWPVDPYPLLAPYTRPETFAGRERELDECEQTVTRRCKLVLCRRSFRSC